LTIKTVATFILYLIPPTYLGALALLSKWEVLLRKKGTSNDLNPPFMRIDYIS